MIFLTGTPPAVIDAVANHKSADTMHGIELEVPPLIDAIALTVPAPVTEPELPVNEPEPEEVPDVAPGSDTPTSEIGLTVPALVTEPELPVSEPEPEEVPDVAPGSDTPTFEDEIIVTGDTQVFRTDPLQEVNLISYQAVQTMDQALVAPVAKGYQNVIPEPVRDGLGNALRNISEPVNFLNFLLQLKIGKAAETVGRFAVNSTLGFGGLFDVAKEEPFKLPHRRNGLANTLGFYGIKPGPYFYLPLIGPTTLRDMAGNSLDLLLLPTVIGKPFDRRAYALPTNVVMQLNARIDRDAEIERLQQESYNPYAETRALYLEMRRNEIEALKTKRHKQPPAPVAEVENPSD